MSMTSTTLPAPHDLDRLVAWLEPWGENTPHREAAEALKALRAEVERLRGERLYVIGHNDGFAAASEQAAPTTTPKKWRVTTCALLVSAATRRTTASFSCRSIACRPMTSCARSTALSAGHLPPARSA